MTTSDRVEAYVASWNERDEGKRRALLESAFAPGGTYVDPTAEIAGVDALVAHIAGVQASVPGYKLDTNGSIDEHHGRIRFRWSMCNADGNAVVQGVDFGSLAPDGRIASITGFFDPN